MLDLELGVAQIFYEADLYASRREDLTYEVPECFSPPPPLPKSVCCVECGSELHSMRGHAGRCLQNVKAVCPSLSRACPAERRDG